jgi:hypothetical protein
MLILLDYPSVQDLKESKQISGYPAALFEMASRYAGLGSHEIHTLFPDLPPYGNPNNFFHKKKDCPLDEAANPRHKAGILKSKYLPDYHRVRELAKSHNLILTMGDFSLWCLTGENLADHRGTILYYDKGIRVIPTHNPRAIVKQQGLLPIVAMDMKKAWQESLKPRSVFPRRQIHLVESLRDMDAAVEDIFKEGQFAFDIETSQQQITMICFAPSPTKVYVLPIWFHDHIFWDPATELQMWLRVQKLMASPLRKVAHNAVYDLTYLVEMGMKIRYPVEDTMLKSHSNEIEWLKSLGFLGSIYCNEKSWKLMRVGKVKDRNKKDE